MARSSEECISPRPVDGGSKDRGEADCLQQNVERLMARLRTGVAKTEADTAHRALLAADIKRFLERGLDPARPIPLPAADAPPGAPIGDEPLNWLAPAPYYPRR